MNEGNKAHETKILEMKQQHELNTKESEKIITLLSLLTLIKYFIV